MDRRTSLRVHLHPSHFCRSRLMVRASAAPLDVPWNTGVQDNLLAPLLLGRNRDNRSAQSHRVEFDLAFLENLASGRNVACFHSDDRRAHLWLCHFAPLPQGGLVQDDGE